MLTPRVLVACLLSPWLVSAALFPAKTEVKIIDAKGFHKVMNHNVTSVVAFVAPWCGHCQRMAPEYSKAAEALAPMVPLFAVDCDQEPNKRLCSEQGVKGFPTVKLYPRGGRSKPLTFDSGERTATNFFHWATRSIPHGVKKLNSVAETSTWTNEYAAKPRALLLSSSKDIPLIWKALGNKYKDSITFGILHDKSGKQAVKLGVEELPTKDSKVLIYPQGSQDYVQYQGTLKYKPLNKYLGSVTDGSAEFPKGQVRAGGSSVTAKDQVSSSKVVIEDATPLESATSSTVTSASLIPTHVEQVNVAGADAEAILIQDATVGGTEDRTDYEPSNAPQTTATSDPDAGERARSDHSRDEL